MNPFQRCLAVLDEPLAMALVSSALLANESAGAVRLALDGSVLQAAPTGAGTLWPESSLEDRLRRDRRLPVAKIVEDWLASSSDVPYSRAVELAKHGMVTRGLAMFSKVRGDTEIVLTEATRLAATTIDGSAALDLLEACRRERPQVWQALQKALAEAFKKRTVKQDFGYSTGWNYSAEVAFSRDAPLGVKVVNEEVTKYASEVDPNPVQLLEASPATVGAASDRPDEYSTQRRIASKLPAWAMRLISLFKGVLSPTSAEVQAAIKARMAAQKSAGLAKVATGRYETVDTSPSTPMGQQENIPMRIFAANELPAPTAAHRELLDRSSRDWARLQHQGWGTRWWQWRRKRARARLLQRLPKPPFRLLMLRVFGSPSYDDLIELIQPWRRARVIQHLEGFDTIGTRPEAIKAVKSGRIEDILVETKEQVERELSALSLKPDKQLLFERHAFQCTSATWQLAVRGMMDRADAVVMDLSSLSPTNQGCAWEIGQLLDRVPLLRVTLLVNDSTDLKCLQTLLDDVARRVAAKSPNRDNSEVFCAWCASVDWPSVRRTSPTSIGSVASTAAWSRRFSPAFCWIPRSRAGATHRERFCPAFILRQR